MNCPHCQRPLPPCATFCSGCGYQLAPMVPAYPVVDPYAQQYQQYQQQKNALRQNEIGQLENLIRYFSGKQTEYDAYDDACKKLLHYAKGASNALIVWGGILLGIGLIALISFLDSGDLDDGLPVALLMFMLPGMGMVVGGILNKVSSNNKHKQFQQTYQYLSQDLYAHYLGYPNCPVGPEYSNPAILHKLMQILRSGRCDTIQEAINCMIADANHAAITRYCQQIQKETAAINANTRVGTIFAAGRFYR